MTIATSLRDVSLEQDNIASLSKVRLSKMNILLKIFMYIILIDHWMAFVVVNASSYGCSSKLSE